MNVKSEVVVRTMKIFGELLAIWPDFGTNLVIRITKELMWLLAISNLMLMIIPIISGVYQDIYMNKPLRMLKRLMPILVYLESVINCFMWKWKKHQLKKLLLEMCNFVKSATGEDKNMFKKLINQYLPLHTIVVVASIIACLSCICEPIFSRRVLPSFAYYPFEIEPYTIRHYLLYTQQATAVLQAGLHHTVAPIILAILLIYVIAKLKLLSLRLKTINTMDELSDWIRCHQDCIKYFKLLEETIRFIIFKSFIIITMSVIFSGVLAIHSFSIVEIIKLIFTVATGCIAVYVYVSAADDLHELSEKISWSAYESSWIQKPIIMRKSIIILICRTQKPLAISIKGIIPALTRNFYASYLSFALSYYMTLRVLFKVTDRDTEV